MVTDIHFRRVTGLPTICESNALYFVLNGGTKTVDLYITGNDRQPLPVITAETPLSGLVLANSMVSYANDTNIFSNGSRS